MLCLILGGSASGKSEYAESIAVNAEGEKLYLATLDCHDAESRNRIYRHRKLREGKGFTTVERSLDIGGATVPVGGVVLLECLSTLLSNELFIPSGANDTAETAIIEGLLRLKSKASHLIIVSNQVFYDGITYDEATENYLAILASLHRQLALEADFVTEIVCKIPIRHK